MLIKDFLVLRTPNASKRNIKQNATALLIPSETEWQLAEDHGEPRLKEPKLDSFSETKEELEVVHHK
jgi:hypothetical protein